MGLSSSQARLLCLTSKNHDIELKAQRLMAEKISLATQRDKLYMDYCEALDAQKIGVAFIDSNAKTSFVDATYNTLCSYNENRIMQYCLRNNQSGKIIVSEAIKAIYDLFGYDKDLFASTMVAYDNGEFTLGSGIGGGFAAPARRQTPAMSGANTEENSTEATGPRKAGARFGQNNNASETEFNNSNANFTNNNANQMDIIVNNEDGPEWFRDNNNENNIPYGTAQTIIGSSNTIFSPDNGNQTGLVVNRELDEPVWNVGNGNQEDISDNNRHYDNELDDIYELRQWQEPWTGPWICPGVPVNPPDDPDIPDTPPEDPTTPPEEPSTPPEEPSTPPEEPTTPPEEPTGEANGGPLYTFYANLWEAIKEAGGCEAIDPEVESGKAGSDWLTNMVEAGLITIQVWDNTTKTETNSDSASSSSSPQKAPARQRQNAPSSTMTTSTTTTRNGWMETGVVTSTNVNYLQKLEDEEAVKKAEAEYEHNLRNLNAKDTRIDTDLSKLETTRSAIKAEMESLKNVINENSERSFGIFS